MIENDNRKPSTTYRKFPQQKLAFFLNSTFDVTKSVYTGKPNDPMAPKNRVEVCAQDGLLTKKLKKVKTS